MDEWWVLLRQLKIPPSEIRQMTYPEMKLEMLGRFEQAITEAQAHLDAKQPDTGAHVIESADPANAAQMHALAAAVKAKRAG